MNHRRRAHPQRIEPDQHAPDRPDAPPRAAPVAQILHLQRSAGNAAVARVLGAAATRTVSRFAELEHKEIGDRAVGGVEFRYGPMMTMTYGDMVAMGDYFASPDEIASLAAKPGLGKGTRGEVNYVLFVKIRGEDEDRHMGDWFDESAKEAADGRFFKLAAENVSHFPNPLTGDEKLDPRTKAKRHEAPGKPIGQAATYRDGHMRALRRAIELGRAGKSIGGALALDAFANHFLTDAFSAGHIRTPRKSIHHFWHNKVPDFNDRFQKWLANTMATWIRHNGPQYAQAAPQGLRRSKALEKVRAALKNMPPMSFGDVISGAVHDFDSDRGVLVTVAGKRYRLVGDNRLLEATPGQEGAAQDTMQLAVRAVKAGNEEIEKAYDLGKAGAALDAVVARLAPNGLFAAELLVPEPVPDAKLTAEDKALKWHFESAADLLEDKRMRKAIVTFANEKAEMFDAIMDDPELDQVAKDGLAIMVKKPMASTDTATVIALFKSILGHRP